MEVGADQLRLGRDTVVLVNIVGLDVCGEECVVGDRVHGTGVEHVWPVQSMAVLLLKEA